MVRFYQILSERTNAVLYHVMNTAKAYSVFMSDKIPASVDHEVNGNPVSGTSFSRNKRFWFDADGVGSSDYNVKLVVNRAALEANNKVAPFDGEHYVSRVYGDEPNYRDRINTNYGEKYAEDFCIGEIKNLHKKLVAVELRRVESLGPDFVSFVEEWCAKYNVPLNKLP